MRLSLFLKASQLTCGRSIGSQLGLGRGRAARSMAIVPEGTGFWDKPLGSRDPPASLSIHALWRARALNGDVCVWVLVVSVPPGV